ncbi:MAG TPA: multicopper oxidase domain-containing protein, partial [bacterium]|nr:multicopper oxidase domain-containing protein [bacterium]
MRPFFAAVFFLYPAVPAGAASLPVPLGAESPRLKPFVDPLPIPRRIDCAGLPLEHGMATLHVHERQCRHVFHSGLPAALVWGYDGEIPGPTLELREGQALRVYWHNELPLSPLFPVDSPPSQPGICGRLPAVRTVVHVHGASVPGYAFGGPTRNDDGYPDAWTVPGETQEAVYPNRQEAAGLWYHDHAMGSTARNNYAGLAGMYIIRDAYEDGLHLPRGRYEIPLMLRSRAFNTDGSLAYPGAQTSDEVYGDVTDVNGRVWPYLDVEPGLYRFRFLNASTSRSYALKLVVPGGRTVPGPAFHQIGSDGGFLDRPALLNDPGDPHAPRLILAPAERADVLIDFSGCAGKSYVLDNDSQTDESSDEKPIPDVMLFRVGARLHGDSGAKIPVSLRPIPRLDPARALRTRRIYFQESESPGGAQTMLLNGRRWEDPVTERPALGSVEVWELVNGTGELHSFHIHQMQFQVLGRRAFNRFLYEKFGLVVFQGPWMPPEAGEGGWKDTVRISPGLMTRIILQFGPYTGRFVYHCHMLEHEDMDMMRPFDVVPAAGDNAKAAVFLDKNPEIKVPSPLE